MTRGMTKERLLAALIEAPHQYYAVTVARGRSPGMYTSWEEVEPLLNRFTLR